MRQSDVKTICGMRNFQRCTSIDTCNCGATTTTTSENHTHFSHIYERALSVKSKITASVKWSATPIMAGGDKINEFRKNSQPIEFSIFAFRICENSFFNLITDGICSVHVLADLLDICRSRCFPYLHFLDRLIMM